MREGSDCDTFGTEEDEDKAHFLGGSDSNDTDYSAVNDSLALDRRSRRKRSMQRLVAKNKTLKSSLAQAKADLAAERHSRAMIDQIYLKIKKELNSKLETEENKVAELRAELEQMTTEMEELKAKTQNTSSYRIGYDSSNYSLSSALGGGLMLHPSNLLGGQDEEDKFFCPSSIHAGKSRTNKGSSTSPSVSPPPPPPPPPTPSQHEDRVNNKDMDQDSNTSSTTFQQDKEKNLEHGAVEKEDDVEKKVTFLSEPLDIPERIPSSLPTSITECTEAGEESEDDDDDDGTDDDDEEDAPCTMMEMLIKKEQSRSMEDEAQDPPADANETFDSMAHKFLYQALHAKFTPARMILQLDDLLLKYDASPEELVLVLAQESMKWWENERVEAGGPATGGWGTSTVLMAEDGNHVSVKVAVETKFKAIYVPLLLNYVASHQEQTMLLEKMEITANSCDKWKRNHVAQMMALYKFDVLDAPAILEWWRLLKESEGMFGHSQGLRSMSSKFVAWLEDEEEDDSDDDSDDDSEEDEDEDEGSDSEDEIECDFDDDNDNDDGQGKIVGLNFLAQEELMSPRDILQSLDEDLAKAQAKKEELLEIGSDDDGMDDQASTTSSLERIEECERKRRISFCTNNVYIHQDGRVRVDHASSAKTEAQGQGQGQGQEAKKLDQHPAMSNLDERLEDEDEEEEGEGEEEENDDDDNDN
ncbi:hypothetical protein BGZ54_007316 [Gamsiella multidivaricata]|nr:hypothetical protein BGZ54_007316 [Gamsiella multidivaricata]